MLPYAPTAHRPTDLLPSSGVPHDAAYDLLLGGVRAAVAAPSLHNSQPWRFRLHPLTVDVYADQHRRLRAADPDGRQQLLSVGAALFNLRVTLAAQGLHPTTRLLTDARWPMIARVGVDPARATTPQVRRTATVLAAAVTVRRTSRHPYADRALPADVMDELRAAAVAEGAELAGVGPVHRGLIFALARAAAEQLGRDRAYLSELHRWSPAAPGRADGIPAEALGPDDGRGRLPVRDLRVVGRHAVREPVAEFEAHPTLAVLHTVGDSPRHWLAAGQALQRVLLTATVYGLAVQPMTQPLEPPELRRLLADPVTGRHAQVILRLGYGPPGVPTPRRPLADVIRTRVR